MQSVILERCHGLNLVFWLQSLQRKTSFGYFNSQVEQ